MKIDEMTIGDFKKIATLVGGGQSDNSAWEIGKNYLIRTVTMIDTGRLIAVTQQELILEDAAWIPDTGRFSDAVKNCAFVEVEPFPSGRVILGRGSVIDAICIDELPRKQK
jgi:hypothetical protein